MSSWFSRIERRLAVARQMWRSGDARLALWVFCFAVAAPVLARLPLSRLERVLEPHHQPPGVAHVEHTSEVVLTVLRAGRPLVRTGCLVRGLTLYYFLRRTGADIGLCFGLGSVGEEDDVFGDGYDGHCWLVKDGEPFLEARDPQSRYIVIYRFPSMPRPLVPSRLPAGEEVVRP